MFYCNDCEEFSASKWSHEKHTDVCTYCDSEDIEIATKCKNKACDGYAILGEDYCQECLDKGNDSINILQISLDSDNPTAIDLLKTIIESMEKEERHGGAKSKEAKAG